MLIWPAAGVFEIFHTIYIVEKSMIKLRNGHPNLGLNGHLQQAFLHFP